MPEDHQQIVAALKKIRLFDGLNNAQLEQVASSIHPIQIKEGETLRLDGKNPPFFIVVTGNLRSTRIIKGGEGETYVLKQGDFLGADVVFHGKQKSLSNYSN